MGMARLSPPYISSLAPHLLERIFARLQDLKTPDTTTFEARVTLAQHLHQRWKPYEVCVTLTGRGEILQARQRGTVLDTMVETALEDIAAQLNASYLPTSG